MMRIYQNVEGQYSPICGTTMWFGMRDDHVVRDAGPLHFGPIGRTTTFWVILYYFK